MSAVHYRIVVTQLPDDRAGYNDRFKLEAVTAFGVHDVLVDGSWRVVHAALSAHVRDLEYVAPRFP